MKNLSIALLSFMLMTAAKCQGLTECPRTADDFHQFKLLTMSNKNRKEGLKNFKRLVTTTKIANCKDPFDKAPLIQEFAFEMTRAAGQQNFGQWDEYFSEMVRHLMSLNVDLEATNDTARRSKALMQVCNGGTDEMLDLLLELGADPNVSTVAVSGTVVTTLEVCAREFYPYGVRRILETGLVADKQVICNAYWAKGYPEVLAVFEEFGWNEETCPLAFDF